MASLTSHTVLATEINSEDDFNKVVNMLKSNKVRLAYCQTIYKTTHADYLSKPVISIKISIIDKEAHRVTMYRSKSASVRELGVVKKTNLQDFLSTVSLALGGSVCHEISKESLSFLGGSMPTTKSTTKDDAIYLDEIEFNKVFGTKFPLKIQFDGCHDLIVQDLLKTTFEKGFYFEASTKFLFATTKCFGVHISSDGAMKIVKDKDRFDAIPCFCIKPRLEKEKVTVIQSTVREYSSDENKEYLDGIELPIKVKNSKDSNDVSMYLSDLTQSKGWKSFMDFITYNSVYGFIIYGVDNIQPIYTEDTFNLSVAKEQKLKTKTETVEYTKTTVLGFDNEKERLEKKAKIEKEMAELKQKMAELENEFV